MDRIVNALAVLLAILFASIGLRWLVDPAGAAPGLGMVLQQGAGLAAQIGDLAAFFLGAATLLLVGVIRRRSELLVAAGALIGVVALFRLLAWLLHDAALTPGPMVVEIVTLIVALRAAGIARRAQ